MERAVSTKEKSFLYLFGNLLKEIHFFIKKVNILKRGKLEVVILLILVNSDLQSGQVGLSLQVLIQLIIQSWQKEWLMFVLCNTIYGLDI
jgi:hypothetical protein